MTATGTGTGEAGASRASEEAAPAPAGLLGPLAAVPACTECGGAAPLAACLAPLLSSLLLPAKGACTLGMAGLAGWSLQSWGMSEGEGGPESRELPEGALRTESRWAQSSALPWACTWRGWLGSSAVEGSRLDDLMCE